MIGQETTPTRPLRMRKPSAQQNAVWLSALRLVDECSDLMLIDRQLAELAEIEWKFAKQNGLSMDSPAEIEKRLIDAETGFVQLRHLIRRVQNHDLAIQFRPDGDFDIVDPHQGEQGLGWVWLVVGGLIIIAAAAIAGLKYYRKEFKNIQSKYNPLVRATDRMFCQQGSPETCAEWQRFREREGYTEKLDIIDEIGRSIGHAGSTGVRWGLSIGLPLVALWLLWSLRKKR